MKAIAVEDSPGQKSDPLSVNKLLPPALSQGNDETVCLPEDSFDDCGSLFGNREEQFALEQFLYNRTRF